jgi:thiol:disulfide interchange protein DsbD
MNKQKYILLYFLFLLPLAMQAQVLHPIEWQTTISKQEVQIGETLELIFTADIEKDWYLYSSDFSKDLGPMVTTFDFQANDTYELVGELTPINPSKKDSELWGGEYTYFKGKAEFRQKVKVLKKKPNILVTVDYQVCTDVDGKCIPLDEEFSFTSIKVLKKKNALSDSGDKDTEDKSNSENQSILTFMFLSFLGGLAALLTPCVFPIIPMTVSFFTSKAETRSEAIRQGLLYGAAIVGIYTLIGVLVSYLFGAEAANVLATHWLPNLLFFAIFVIFAISFFGAFEIVLPSSWINSMDRKADKGGLLGIFFMALTLVVISFSCTGPIAGSILIASANGDFLMPMLGMFSFSMAFAIPFSLFAIFPAWLSSLPKSGGWLNTVKVVLGFIELALAFKFLSVADQVYHWGILDRDIYITIWIAIGIALGLYLFGLISLPHDSKLEKIGVGRLLLAILTFTFVIYLIPGLFGAPLKGLAGYLPPQSTLDFDINKIVRDNIKVASFKNPDTKVVNTGKRKYTDLFHLPHGLEGYFDYQEALEASKREGKPIFIDFTGHGCVNCREMEATVWAEPAVLQRLSEDYILLALYVDDPTTLPEDQWIKAKDGKTKKTIGKINANFQIERFNNNAQPYYVLLDTEGEMLIKKPKAYDLNPANFVEYLDIGLAEFNKR